jgi:RHS repeat-associated protein
MLEGELNVTSGQKLIYMPDQLNSVRDVIDATTGTRVASYDYAPYGGVARSAVTNGTDYQYSGLFKHAASGLNLGPYREQDGNTGRWINRDPIRETGGINLYNYVGANTISRIDPKGLAFGDFLAIPPGYNPTLWNIAKFDEGAPVQRDPVTGRAFVSNPQQAGNWRKWNVAGYKGQYFGRCPMNLRKPWPNAKRPPYDDQAGSWPENDASAWMPPPTDTFSGSLSAVAIPGDVYNPAPALSQPVYIIPNGEPTFDWY